MRYYCPSCWQDFWEEKFETCPKCGYSIKADSEKDYVDRLLNALNHPSGDVRHWVIMIGWYTLSLHESLPISFSSIIKSI
ncbi:MAG TPA: hypothetical protein PLD92_03425, partial [Candidatus Omnitrophota bacterium]|nr:hypothetical protein [Candidatus Omnitrophota bacterium]